MAERPSSSSRSGFADRAELLLDALRAVAQTGQVVESVELSHGEKFVVQEAGIYHYRHPLTDAVAYEKELAEIEDEIKAMTKGRRRARDDRLDRQRLGREGRTMVAIFEADAARIQCRGRQSRARAQAQDLVLQRLKKVAETIERLGKTMQIRISTPYLQLRVRELELTADFLQKQAEEKEAERLERERLREERKVQQEIERERARLEKERQHYANALEALVAKGDEAGAARLRDQLDDVDRAIEDVDYRAANIRAGYVYVISNIGSFGEKMVKVGMTRRLDPMDRIRELSDASVPFNFDIHALFFSKDAVGIETAMHERLADCA